jgi:hypothetical protein
MENRHGVIPDGLNRQERASVSVLPFPSGKPSASVTHRQEKYKSLPSAENRQEKSKSLPWVTNRQFQTVRESQFYISIYHYLTIQNSDS